MIIICIWIAICVGFVLGAAWAGSHRNEVASDRLFHRSDSHQWVRPALDDLKDTALHGWEPRDIDYVDYRTRET